MTQRVCECRWHLVDENDRAIRVSIYKDGRRAIWIGRNRVRIRNREPGMITFTMAYAEARKRGMI